MKNILFIALVVFLFTACSNNTTQNKKFDEMAIDLCDCMRPLADMNTKLKRLVDVGKNQEAAQLFPEVERITQEGEACAKSLEEKHGIVGETDKPKVTAALKKHCTDIAQMLERSKSMEQ